ncbi:MAG TPA: phosphatidylinositol mannoside acyltransferase [Actinomycetota bacterium]|nr:phosphatidylinositol mannoside acyltransferase [Actinomycetota bacterium]
MNVGPDGVRKSETLGERLSYWEYRSAERAAMALPESVGRRVFSLAGALAFHIAPGARRTVKSNLARVLGRDSDSQLVDAAAREAFRSYARYWYDTFRMRVIPPEEFLKRHGSVGLEHIERALEGGRGALMALPHLGNWDAAGHWLHVLGHSMTAVAEELRPRRVYDLFLEHRKALGIGIVPLTDTRKVGEDLVRLLAKNELIALVCDRDLKNRGVEVTMFGEKRRMPAGPALLSLATGSPLLPCATYDAEEGWSVLIGPPLEVERTGDRRKDVLALTQRLAEEFERAIAAAPTQWHMFQPAWDHEGAPGR